MNDNQQGNEQAGNAQQGGPGEKPFVEEFKVASEDVIAKVKELIREGNVRRIIIKNEEGRTLIEIPLTVGVIGTLLLPVWAAIGAIGALAANLTLTVERRTPPSDAPAAGNGPGNGDDGANSGLSNI